MNTLSIFTTAIKLNYKNLIPSIVIKLIMS